MSANNSIEEHLACTQRKMGGKEAVWDLPRVTGDVPQERWGHSAVHFANNIFIFGVRQGSVGGEPHEKRMFVVRTSLEEAQMVKVYTWCGKHF